MVARFAFPYLLTSTAYALYHRAAHCDQAKQADKPQDQCDPE